MKPLGIIVDFVLAQAQAQPVAKRAELYRALSAISGTSEQGAELARMAEELAAIERRHQQLHLNFVKAQNIT